MIIKRWTTLHPVGATVNAILVYVAGFDPQLIPQLIPDKDWQRVARVSIIIAIALVNTFKKEPEADDVVIPVVKDNAPRREGEG